jgi:hypothetical protein
LADDVTDLAIGTAEAAARLIAADATVPTHTSGRHTTGRACPSGA